MKTTLEVPDDLMREIKVRAAQENRRLKDVITELLRRGLEAPVPDSSHGKRVKLPLVDTGPARSEAELTPERLAEILLEQEISAYQAHMHD
jgi:plasmid stability protein